MDNVKLLDCTLRDGGYINNWDFSAEQIESTVKNLTDAGIEYIEMGYLTSILGSINGSMFQNVEIASKFIPKDRKKSKYVIMADVAQFDTEMLCERNSNTIDGIRVVFYKRQIEQAYIFCQKIAEKGYDLFLQPMVTIDYSPSEFNLLAHRFYEKYKLYCISIVDSFGCMTQSDIYKFIDVLETDFDKNVCIGFHGHDNMKLTFLNAVSLFQYKSERQFVIDSSVCGMGRGAGNLHTELITNYCNMQKATNYVLDNIFKIVSEVVEPIMRVNKWGYTPYFMLTAIHKAHPNFATYLLANHNITVEEFAKYLSFVPDNMLTKCTKPYVEELYSKLKGDKQL